MPSKNKGYIYRSIQHGVGMVTKEVNISATFRKDELSPFVILMMKKERGELCVGSRS